MRIGMMADVYKPHVSGVTNFIASNKRALEQLGHEVHVFTFGDVDFVDDEANVHRSPGLPLVDTGFYFSFSYSPQAKSLLRSMDVVHVHHPFLSGRLAVRYCHPLRIPIVFTNHTRYDLYMQTYLPILADGLGETFLQAYLPSFCRDVDLVISPSQGMEAVLRRLGVDSHVEVVPNGVELDRFQAAPDCRRRKELGFSADQVVLVYSGRLAPEKNLQFLMHAFYGIAHAYPQVRLLVIGDGPERQALEEQVRAAGLAERIQFTGMVPYADMPEYLRAADAFVTASITEVHPLSIIEAMAAGLPALGIISPGVADTIQDDVTGLLSPDDLAAFTAKLARLVTEDETRRKMGAAARIAADEYAIERTSRILVECYEELVEYATQRRRGIRFFVRKNLERWRK
jgi:1,2-diacylglycerol 3-alpha-glucosyltransferase